LAHQHKTTIKIDTRSVASFPGQPG